jgi:hypothetical protein
MDGLGCPSSVRVGTLLPMGIALSNEFQLFTRDIFLQDFLNTKIFKYKFKENTYFDSLLFKNTPCSLGLSATSQQYFSLRTNQPPATSQQYFSLRTNQHQPSATSQTNRLSLGSPL